jgi:iron transport multicopper oxidase
MVRDVAGVKPNGFVVFRFKADNPGIQLRTLLCFIIIERQLTSPAVHCHIEWHVEAGLTATILEGTTNMQHLSIPADAKQNCINGGYLASGNAGGNSANWTDSSNFNTVVPQVNNG